jgi:hypothetical protein
MRKLRHLFDRAIGRAGDGRRAAYPVKLLRRVTTENEEHHRGAPCVSEDCFERLAPDAELRIKARIGNAYAQQVYALERTDSPTDPATQ